MGPKGAFFSNSVSCGYTGHSPKRAIGTIYLIHVTAILVADELEGAGAKSGASPHHQVTSHKRGQWPPLPFLLPDFYIKKRVERSEGETIQAACLLRV